MKVNQGVASILVLGDEGFVDLAYQTILRRRPDANGRAAALAYLSRGGRRLHYLLQMLRSPEAAHGGDMSAMRLEVERLQAKCRMPGIGRFVEQGLLRQIRKNYNANEQLEVEYLFKSYAEKYFRSAYAETLIDLRPRTTYHLNDFYVLHDYKFVIAAYFALLGRAPDADGFYSYLAAIRSGESKAKLLKSLVKAPEAQARKLRIEGLTFVCGFETVLNIPIVGHFISLIVSILTIQRRLRALRALENKAYGDADV